MSLTTRRTFLRAAVGTTAATLTGDVTGFEAHSEWSQYRHDAARTGFTPSASGPATDAQERWIARTEARTVSSPAVIGDSVFVNSDAVAALDADDGTDQWSNAVFYRNGSAPAVVDGVVYAASKFVLWALSAQDGRQRWQFTRGDRALYTPAVESDTVYVVSTASSLPFDATVHALSADDGTERWRTAVGEMTLPPFTPAVADGVVYVGKEKLFALDASDGSVLWTASPDGTLGVPAVLGDTVYVGSRQSGNQGAVFAFDASDGTQLWRTDTGLSAKSLAVVDDEVYVASDAVYALDAGDGSENWRFDSNKYVLAAPAVTAERVYLAGLLGTVRALDRADGTEAWLVRTQATVLSAPAVTDDAVYVGGAQTVFSFG